MDGHKARVLDTLSKPDFVQEGDFGELLAVKAYEDTPFGPKFLVVVYREISVSDGFVLTAYFTRMPSKSRRKVWSP